MERISGIYKITNLINGHMYIGLSKDCLKRKSDHFSKAIHSEKRDDLRKPLYLAIKKYGKENFVFEIIEICEESKLQERESYWIEYYNTYKNKSHYNLTPGGDGRFGENTLRGQEHPCSKLTKEEVIFCRKEYQKDPCRAKAIYDENFSTKINFQGFQKIWHGLSWTHIMPETFEKAKPLKHKFDRAYAYRIKREFEDSGLSLNKFSKTKKGEVGYGTMWRMVHEPDSFIEKIPTVKRRR